MRNTLNLTNENTTVPSYYSSNSEGTPPHEAESWHLNCTMHPPLLGHSSSILFSNNGKKCKIRFQFAVGLGVYSVHKETYNWSHLRHRIYHDSEAMTLNLLHNVSSSDNCREDSAHGRLGMKNKKNMKSFILKPVAGAVSNESDFLKQLKGFLESCSCLSCKIKPRMKRG